jgi:hypothetical protein
LQPQQPRRRGAFDKGNNWAWLDPQRVEVEREHAQATGVAARHEPIVEQLQGRGRL